MKNNVTVKFTLSCLNESGKTITYESIRKINIDDSIREVANSVVDEAAERGVNILGYEKGAQDHVSIHLMKPSSVEHERNIGQGTFGISYGLDSEGALKVYSNLNSLLANWTFAELSQLVEQGYVKGDPKKIRIGIPMGIGAGPGDLYSWYAFIADTIGILTFVVILLRWAVIKIKNRKHDSTLKKWNRRGITHPSYLREIIDTRAEWKLSEIKKRLDMEESEAVNLLKALGLESVGQTWRLTHSKNSISKRKKWSEREKKYDRLERII